MSNSWNCLKQQREVLKNLQKIKKDADPASGISFQVRRGVIRDNPDYEYEEETRPVIPVEFGSFELSQKALDLLIEGVEDSINFWKKAVRNDMETAEQILNEDD